MKRLLMAIIFVAMCVTYAFAGSVTLEWDANTEADLAGYYIYMDTAPNVTSDPAKRIATVPAGTETLTYQLPQNGTYYFVATAYNTAGLESGLSNECNKVIADAPQPPGGMTCN